MPASRFSFLSALVLIALGACTRSPSTTSSPSNDSPPPVQREMRAIWITTVGNTDWPSRNNLSVAEQQAELIDLLDRAVAGGINAVMFHVRPAGDAVYASALEPWASMLTGTQGKDPGYDPLAFAVAAAHARGLEIHAWINPFRAGNTKDSAALSSTHSFTTRRDIVRVYGTQLWFDPGEPLTNEHAMRVISDIVRRYDIDGMHADDYFYPYQQNDSAGHPIDFPDSASYARSGTQLERGDWRRDNVDRFVERMYREVHAIKPGIRVSLSPFGIWRPGNPPVVKGLDAYASIYADSKKWLQRGWVDFYVPQLYWAIASPGQPFPDLLDWWTAQDTLGRHIWPGLATYRVASGAANALSTEEIPNQVLLTRARSNEPGHVMFNTTTALKKNDGAVIRSLAALYGLNALVPGAPWLDRVPTGRPSAAVSGHTVQLIPADGEQPRWWVVQSRIAGAWSNKVLFGDARSYELSASFDRMRVIAVDQAGNMSQPFDWRAP